MSEPIDSPKIREVIRELLSRGHAYTTYEVVGYLQITTGKLISESACSARIRELRNKRYGGHIVRSKPRKGCTAWEYWIEVRNERAA